MDFQIFYSRRVAQILHSIPIFFFFVMPFMHGRSRSWSVTLCDFVKGKRLLLISSLYDVLSSASLYILDLKVVYLYSRRTLMITCWSLWITFWNLLDLQDFCSMQLGLYWQLLCLLHFLCWDYCSPLRQWIGRFI